MPERRRRVLAAALLLVATPALARDCAPTARLTADAPGLVSLSARFPCRPYATVTLQYGAITVREELSLEGRLDVVLPVLPGRDGPSLTVSGETRALALPAGATVAPAVLVALWPDGAPPGMEVRMVAESGPVSMHAGRLGFPGLGAAMAFGVATTAAAAELVLPVTEDTCGRTLTAQVLDEPREDPRAVSIAMPACRAVGQSIRVPIAP